MIFITDFSVLTLLLLPIKFLLVKEEPAGAVLGGLKNFFMEEEVMEKIGWSNYPLFEDNELKKILGLGAEEKLEFSSAEIPRQILELEEIGVDRWQLLVYSHRLLRGREELGVLPYYWLTSEQAHAVKVWAMGKISRDYLNIK